MKFLQEQKQRKCRKYVENMWNLKIMYFQVQVFPDNRRNYTIRTIFKVQIQEFQNLCCCEIYLK